MRFVAGHQPLGRIVIDTTKYPTTPQFTLVESFYAIGHVNLCTNYLVSKLKRFYRSLEYSPAYYALLTPGADPQILRKKVAKGEIKLHLLSDLLEKALWSKKHLIWFESDEEDSYYRVRSSSLCKDTMAIIQGVMKCSG